MNEKIFKMNKFYTTFLFIFLPWTIYLVFFENQCSSFWKYWNLVFLAVDIIGIIIFLTSRVYLKTDSFEEKFILKRSFKISEIDYVIYKRTFQDNDFNIYFKEGRKYIFRFNFNNEDAKYFINYLEKNGVEVIEKRLFS